MINLQTVAIFSTDRSIRNFASHGKIIVFTVGEQFAGQRRHERHGSNRPSTTAISTTFYEVNSVVIRRALFPRLKGKAFAHRRIACVDASGHIVECKPRSQHLNRSFLRPPSLPVPLLTRHSSNVPTSLESIFSPTSPLESSEFLFNALSCAQFTSVALEHYVFTIEKSNVEGIKRYGIVWKRGEARVFLLQSKRFDFEIKFFRGTEWYCIPKTSNFNA